ncbi:MAG: gamma carbonic anhydrase family protein [Thermoplasmata archaeon]
MALRKFGEKMPLLGKDVYVDESAQVIGDVHLMERSSVWPLAVLRGDDDKVEIGRGSAMMDMSFAEAPKGRPVVVGDGCIVSHTARLHGCSISRDTMVGIGSIVLDNATIGEACVIAAGSLVPPGTKIPARSFVMGVPGKIVRQTSSSEVSHLKDELRALAAKIAKYRETGPR